jgi:predicted metal-dependent HD superfamily phosphohydrolase
MYFNLPTSALNLLIPLYNSPQRHYHNLAHIHYCLAKLDECRKHIPLNSTQLGVLTLAIWFHDAVYSPFKWTYTSNEKESADLFKEWWKKEYSLHPATEKEIRELDDIRNAVVEAILFTEKHLEFTIASELPNFRYTTTPIMLDIDMSGFARGFEEVYKDSGKIFKEYEALGLPEKVMLQHRIDFLEALLKKESIYNMAYFKDTHEIPAQHNIESVIELSKAALDK